LGSAGSKGSPWSPDATEVEIRALVSTWSLQQLKEAVRRQNMNTIGTLFRLQAALESLGIGNGLLLVMRSCCSFEAFMAARMDGPSAQRREVETSLPQRKPPALVHPDKLEQHLTEHEPLIDAEAASAYMGFEPITMLRMAKCGVLPTIAIEIGTTGKFRYRFKMSQLAAYVEARARAAKVA
jgi:hypothetical protein